MAKKKIPNLIVEKTEEQGNLMFLSLLEYRKEQYLVVVDNIAEDGIGAYVLDYAEQEGMDLKQLISVITLWFYKASFKYPLSFEFSRLGMTPMTNRIYKTFETTHVTRLVGNDFKYDIESQPKVKRRRVNKIPAGIEVKIKKSS